jgi:hypothetical protein
VVRGALPALALAALAASAAAQDDGPAVTVYSSAGPADFDPQQFMAQAGSSYDVLYPNAVPGFAVVKETRSVRLAAGVSELKLTDVAGFIDPTTVSFDDLTDPAGTTVLSQEFRFDLADPLKILQRYVDREVGYVVEKDGQVVKSVTGTLISTNPQFGQITLRTPVGLRFLSMHDPGLRLPALPEGLLTKPTLLWKLSSATGGEHRVRTTYETKGVTWRADYNLVLAADDKKADLGAWVTLLNLSGASWKDARLKLVAGDVNRVQPPPADYPVAPMEDSVQLGAVAGFAEKSFFEYHLYTLPRKTDVLANTTQQLTLFPTARDVGVEKVLVYYGLPEARHWAFGSSPNLDRDLRGGSNPKVDVYLRFKNEKANRLGLPLPRGRLRVYKADDADGTLEFLGEDVIDHTPKDEPVLVRLGNAFDVVGERRQVSFDVDRRAHRLTESFEIALRNHKDAPVRVVVKENLYRWTNWEVVEKSDDFEKKDARTIQFEVEVPPNGARSVTYAVRYSW